MLLLMQSSPPVLSQSAAHLFTDSVSLIPAAQMFSNCARKYTIFLLFPRLPHRYVVFAVLVACIKQLASAIMHTPEFVRTQAEMDLLHGG